MMTSHEMHEVMRTNKFAYSAFGLFTCDDDVNIGIDDALDIFSESIAATKLVHLWLCDKSMLEAEYAEDIATIEKALEINASNSGRHIYLVAGNKYRFSWRDEKIIIDDANVLAIIK